MRILIAVLVTASLVGAAAATAAKPKITPPPKLNGSVAPSGAVALMTGAGTPAVRLHAGWYTVTIKDLSAKLPFRLVGPGVNRSTGSHFKGAVIWGIHFRSGVYRFESGAAPAKSLRVTS